MVKVKWLYSELPLTLVELSKLMKNQQYSEENGWGFLLSVSTSKKLSGKYIERLVQKTAVEDPFGKILEVESVSYYTCQFNWCSESNYMYITNPPRSLKKFLNKLHNMTGLGFVLSEISVALENWTNLLEKEANYLNIVHLSSYGIRISKDSTAQVIVRGINDVRSELSSIVLNKKYFIDSVKFNAEFDNLEVVGELSKSGGCKLKSANSNFILELLRNTLEQSSIKP